MDISIIKSEKDYLKALDMVGALFDAPEGSEESEKLHILSMLIEDYENQHYKIDEPDPIDAINFRMDQLGLTRKDLEKTIGPRGRVSEILGKKRSLTLSMIRKLHRDLNIPADILIKKSA